MGYACPRVRLAWLVHPVTAGPPTGGGLSWADPEGMTGLPPQPLHNLDPAGGHPGPVIRLQILHVPDCPGAEALDDTLAPLLANRPGIQVMRQVVATEEDAAQLGMTGSPTILADGADPFARPGLEPSLSCRLYRDENGRLGPAPSVAQLCQVLGLDIP